MLRNHVSDLVEGSTAHSIQTIRLHVCFSKSNLHPTHNNQLKLPRARVQAATLLRQNVLAHATPCAHVDCVALWRPATPGGRVPLLRLPERLPGNLLALCLLIEPHVPTFAGDLDGPDRTASGVTVIITIRGRKEDLPGPTQEESTNNNNLESTCKAVQTWKLPGGTPSCRCRRMRQGQTGPAASGGFSAPLQHPLASRCGLP